uniref:Putative cytochrome P450 6a23 n=1 Tax=Anoplophora glabripennis TaxID=217634 RepID=V5GJG1_ANOGL
MFFTDSILYDFIAIVIALLAGLIAYYKWTFAYWKQNGFEGPEPSIPFGNVSDLILGKRHLGEMWKDVYFYAEEKGLRYSIVFFFWRPSIIIVDLELIKSIVQTDFAHFWGHGSFINEQDDPLSANVFNLEGPKWRSVRVKLTPTFTSGKMKMMFQTLVDCAKPLKDILDGYCNENKEIELKEYLARFTTDAIGSCAFGLDCNSLKNPDSEFRKYGLRAVKIDLKHTLKRMLQIVFPPSVLRFIKHCPTDPQVAKFFNKIVRDTVDYREKNNVRRKDFMDLLIQIKNKRSVGDDDSDASKETLTMDEITAQSLIFFVAGFETSSTTMHCAAYELAMNPDIQDRLREEIIEVLEKYNNVLTYDAVAEMKYLDRTVSETLRKYPALPLIFRKCSKDYIIPGTDKVITKGSSVMVPILGVHYDPDYYPDPDKFDPDRFTEENKAKRPGFTWLPFGEGPRICIGMRFGLMQTKIGLITLLSNFRVSMNKETKTPLKLSKHGVLISFEGKVLFDLQKI